ncbi:DUF5691 domain-containing protein [uncultured Sphingomonas sp.]|uniref:DUF5691 domain-containing protein n=1 Tax=uncultured Sphingomonas sp. TaxID=158754 RepID=UPI0025D10B17|nr:DUF5691 domain-containing protein [uncultured Sphingomonas sp.]
MADAILDALGPVLTRWTMGGSATAVAPAAWRDVLGAEAGEAELRLLALSGHVLGGLTIPEPIGEVRPLADIPVLARPPLPDPLRPRARRLLRQLRDASARRPLLDFLDSRGWTLHPGDWMPRPSENVPGVYAPWQDWATASGPPSSAPDLLNDENWEDFGPAARHAAFVALRRRDPAQAHALLAGKIAGETPDHRVRLLETLGTGLSDADRPLLEQLSGDRAPRVKALAAALLARLGHGAGGDDDAAELAAFFAVQTKGLLRRTRVIVPQVLKTPAQKHRRAALLEAVPFDIFAQALGLSSPELIQAWPWGSDAPADAGLAAMVARSGADSSVEDVQDALTTNASVDPHAVAQLLPRLAASQRREAATRLLRRGASFATGLLITGGDGTIEDAMRMPAGQALLAAAKAGDVGDATTELLALGLLASRDAARQALDQLAAAGVIAADPRLDMLRLNAALDNRRPIE